MSIQNEIERLQRTMKAEPDNPLLKEQYELALLRADQKEILAEFFEFQYLCPKQWSELKTRKKKKLLDKGIRYCTDCKKEVHFVKSMEALKKCAQAGQCVAVLQEKTAQIFDTLAQEYGGKSDRKDIPSCILKTMEDPTREYSVLLGRPSTEWIV